MKLYGIEVSEERLHDAIIEATKSAYRYTCCEYRLILRGNGDLDIMETFPGDNAVPYSVWKGTDHILEEFCCQNFDPLDDWWFAMGVFPDEENGLTEQLISEWKESDDSITEFLYDYPEIYDAILDEAINTLIYSDEHDGEIDAVIQIIIDNAEKEE